GVAAGAFFYGDQLLKSWDATVLAQGTYDFVEFHWYADSLMFPFPPPDDARLLSTAVDELDEAVGIIRDELTTAGHPDTPIYLGEFNAPSRQGKQSVSIVSALFLGMATAEAIRLGLDAASMWNGWDAVCGNNPGDVYGWQDFGTFSLFQVGDPPHPEYYRCAGAHPPPKATPLPPPPAPPPP